MYAYMLNLSLAGLLFVGVPSLANEEVPTQSGMAYEMVTPQSAMAYEGAPTQSALSACLGANVTFPWFRGSTLLPGDAELEQDADQADFSELWWAREERESVTVLGSYSSAHELFLASPAYGHRVDLSAGRRGMVLRGLTIQDSATYSLLAMDKDGENNTVLQELLLTVEGLASSDGDVHVQMAETALWDSHSSQWRVSLTCGNFSVHALPSFDVVWTTPTGVDLPSSNFSNGQFYLLLTPPILGGRYSCRVPQELFANACIPSGGGSQGDGKVESSVWVEEPVSRLMILAAEHSALAAENRQLREKQTRLTEELKTGEERRTNESRRWEEELKHVREEAERQREEMTGFREEMRQMVREEVNGVNGVQEQGRSQNLSESISRLKEKINLLGTTIAFMTKLGRTTTLRADQRIKPEDIQYNEGNGYSSATGAFTAPLAGTYLFFLKTESNINKPVSLKMKKEGNRLLNLYAHDAKSFLTTAGSVVTHLNRGERVWVDTQWDSWVTSLTRFGGFLVRPDVS